MGDTILRFVFATLGLLGLTFGRGQPAMDVRQLTMAANWNFSDAADWSRTWPTCAGYRQSPVEITNDNAVNVTGVPKVEFLNTEKIPKNVTVVNSGIGIRLLFTYADGETPYSRGSFLDNEYIFQYVNIHSGPDDEHGSLHTINGKGSPLEFELIHINKKYNNDLTTALQNGDGLLVNSFFFQVNGTKNPAIAKFEDQLSQISQPASYMSVDPFPLTAFSLSQSSPYYYYLGSVPFPPCQQSVINMLPTVPFYGSEEQVEKIRAIKFVTGDNSNIRPPQPLNGRTVLFVQGDI